MNGYVSRVNISLFADPVFMEGLLNWGKLDLTPQYNWRNIYLRLQYRFTTKVRGEFKEVKFFIHPPVTSLKLTDPPSPNKPHCKSTPHKDANIPATHHKTADTGKFT